MEYKNTILVVDDQPDILFATIRLLKKAGYNVVSAENGAQALQRAKEYVPDLLLLDQQLPDIDGLEVVRTLKADTSTAAIYICMLSGARITSSDQSDGLDIGADEYLTRPIPNRELLARVTAMLRVQNADKELIVHRDRLDALVEERTLELQQEVADHQRTLATLISTERKWKSVLDNAPLICISLNLQGELTFINNYFLQLTGWSDQEILGKNWFDVFIPEDCKAEVS